LASSPPPQNNTLVLDGDNGVPIFIVIPCLNTYCI
jgi:hypothetical protein